MILPLAQRALLIAFVLLTCIGCDQATKSMARDRLPKSEIISLLNDVFRLQYTENSGAFLSLGANAAEDMRFWVFTILTGFILAGLLIYTIASKQSSKVQIMAFSLILGGGAGNLIDRICHEGRVVDFLNLGIGSWRTGVFNVADVAILIGGLWLFVSSIKRPEEAH